MTTQEKNEEIIALLGREPTEQETALINDFSHADGFANKLLKKIGKVNIDHPVMIRAFRDFIEKSGGEIESFHLLDLLSFQESVCKKSFTYANVGDIILCFSQTPKDRKLAKQVFRNSVNGFYELIDRTNGFALDISILEGDLGILAGKRFVFTSEKRVNQYCKKALAEGISVYKLGFVTSEKKIVIFKNGVAAVDIKKELLIPNENEEQSTVNIRDTMLEDFKKGYLSILYYKYGISAAQYFPVVVGASGSISQMMAMLLGIYTASKALSLSSVKILLSEGTEITLPIGQTNLFEHNYVYLIKPSCNQDGIPFVDSYNRINSYLQLLRGRGQINFICPVVTNIPSSIEQLIRDDLYFEPSSSYDQFEFAKASVLVVTTNAIDGKLLGNICRKQ